MLLVIIDHQQFDGYKASEAFMDYPKERKNVKGSKALNIFEVGEQAVEFKELGEDE